MGSNSRGKALNTQGEVPTYALEIAQEIHARQLRQVRYDAESLISRSGQQHFQVKDRYDEIFETELRGWCYGIESYPGPVYPGLLHRIVQELAPALHTAIENNVVFDVCALAANIHIASKKLVPVRDIVFSLLFQLPHPSELSEDGMFVLGSIIDRVEQDYPGVYERLQRKWASAKRAA